MPEYLECLFGILSSRSAAEYETLVGSAYRGVVTMAGIRPSLIMPHVTEIIRFFLDATKSCRSLPPSVSVEVLEMWVMLCDNDFAQGHLTPVLPEILKALLHCT
ncbi:hypothetical protein KIPB_012206, partial [Kipferlia bialata]|eukprot:g12206.t1